MMSRVTCHVSPVTCHMSIYIYIFNLFKKNGQSGGASRWRVCYQWGLHRLVFYPSLIHWVLLFLLPIGGVSSVEGLQSMELLGLVWKHLYVESIHTIYISTTKNLCIYSGVLDWGCSAELPEMGFSSCWFCPDWLGAGLCREWWDGDWLMESTNQVIFT